MLILAWFKENWKI